jgi:hypothetical protein
MYSYLSICVSYLQDKYDCISHDFIRVKGKPGIEKEWVGTFRNNTKYQVQHVACKYNVSHPPGQHLCACDPSGHRSGPIYRISCRQL